MKIPLHYELFPGNTVDKQTFRSVIGEVRRNYNTGRIVVIIRLIQKKTDRRYSVEKIIECLNKIACSNEQDNLYLFDYRSEISDDIGNVLGIDFTRKRLRLADIKNILANSKK